MSGWKNPKLGAERLSDASIILIDIAKSLLAVRARIDDPVVGADLEVQINRLADIANRISTTAAASVL
jgi:hypothetical protein